MEKLKAQSSRLRHRPEDGVAGPGRRRPLGAWRAGFPSAVGLGLWSLLLVGLSPLPAHAAAATALTVSREGRPGFTRLLPHQTSLEFTNRLSDAAAAANQIRLNGSGVALGDVDGDGRPDLFVCGLEEPNRLFLNLGRLQFVDATGGSPAALPGSFCTGAVLADVDGDGDLDLVVTALGEGARLFLNDGKGRFALAADSGLRPAGGATTATLADVNGDGHLDLYVANYRTTTIRTTGFALHNLGGRRVVPPELRDDLEITPDGRILEHGEPDVLYLNDGRGRFRAVDWARTFFDEAGAPVPRPPRDWGLAAMFRDLNQDGAPDLYVCNDFHSPDRVWLNDGAGRFHAAPRLALRQTSTFSMAVDFADLDRDGWDDFFLADMLDPRRERRMAQFGATEPSPAAIGVYDDRPQHDRNTLFRNRGDGTYAELAHFAGLEASGWTWSAAFLDVDLDGFEDVLMTTGHLFDTQDLDAAARIERGGPYRRDEIPRKLLMYPRLTMPKAAFRNRGNWRFEDAAAAWGFADEGVAHGMAFADLDGDGDLDVVVNHLNGPLAVYRNDATAARVAVRLRGRPPNTAGIGARIAFHAAGRTQAQEVQAGGRYLSSDDPMRVFALPDPTVQGRLVVAWRSGRVSELRGVRANHRYVIEEPDTPPDWPASLAARQPPPPPGATAWFSDHANALDHRHHEEPFDDFARQPLLPRRLSQPGPGAAWADLDGDGRDELVLGTGRGGRLAAFRWDGERFQPLPLPANVAERDATALALAPDGRGLLVGESSWEDGLTNRPALHLWPVKAGAGHPPLPSVPTTAALALTDPDGSGRLALLVGGHAVAGRYPEATPSRLFRLEDGAWRPDPAADALLAGLGLVSAALWTDLDADGFPELVTASEWGPIRVFKNRRGRLESWDVPLVAPVSASHDAPHATLRTLTGWWTTLASGDFDGDGRPDLVAGNWGLNSRHRAAPGRPVRLYYGDLDGDGAPDLIETSFDPRLGREVPDRDLLALTRGIPSLAGRFTTHAAYAVATLEQVLGRAPDTVPRLEAVHLASVLLLNRGDRLELRDLPDEAQLAPAMAAAVADFDGDGHDDLFLAQNFFAVEPTRSRLDAGRGLMLRNAGGGRFEPLSAQQGGVAVWGEQRGAATADFDADGRPDLVVTQNGAATRLFRNAAARPGLRVRVEGPPGNPPALGAALRLRQGGWGGPVRELQAGGGGLSQPSLTHVLARPEGPAQLEVRWPGGRVTTVDVPADAGEARVKP